MDLLYCCCFCFDLEDERVTRLEIVKKKKNRKSAIETRLHSKYKEEDFVMISDDDRKSKKVKAYCCPICTNYYTSILLCI
jgi:hypothetical protein